MVRNAQMTFICICSAEYMGYYNILYESLKTFYPEAKQILYYIGNNPTTRFDEVINITNWYDKCNSNYTKLEKICSLRAKVVLDAFNRDHQKVVFLGAKVQFFSQDYLIETILDDYNAFVTPHILEPFPEDGLLPSNSSIAWTGHISTDVIAFKNTPQVVKFLTWQDEIMKTRIKTTNYTYLDQSWLNFLPFFVDDVYICRDPAYNVAYWNYTQRNLRLTPNKKWIIGDYEYWKMVCFQFSGFDLNNPVNISIHQNRYKADGDFLNFLTTYANRVKEYK